MRSEEDAFSPLHKIYAIRSRINRVPFDIPEETRPRRLERPATPASECGAMIVPLTPEPVWRYTLDGLPLWHPPRVPTLVVAPHPDDETLGAGGLIAALRAENIPVDVVAVTDGENAYAGPQAECSQLGTLREQEQAAALACLGVEHGHIHRLRLPDSGLFTHEKAIEDKLAALITPGMHVLAPWQRDFHPDHEVCGRAAAAAVQRIAARHAATSPATPFQAAPTLSWYLFWTWHRGTPAMLAGERAARFPVTEGHRRQRAAALACHRSQLHHASGEPILPAHLTSPAQRPYEVFLAHA